MDTDGTILTTSVIVNDHAHRARRGRRTEGSHSGVLRSDGRRAGVEPVNRSELISALRDAGLSPYQADAYVTILEVGAAPVTDIAEASGVPDPRIYDVLRDLEAEGYIELY